jgi:hypothetical protein
MMNTTLNESLDVPMYQFTNVPMKCANIQLCGCANASPAIARSAKVGADVRTWTMAHGLWSMVHDSRLTTNDSRLSNTTNT